MLKLANGCTCSDLCVFPSNWKTGSATLLKKTWYIQYYFYDPNYKEQHKKGYEVKVKGFAKFKTLELRREAVKALLAAQLDLLVNQGYNPILKKSDHKPSATPTTASTYEIDPETPWIDALEKVYPRLKVAKDTKKDMKGAVANMRQASAALRYDNLAIKQIGRKHIKICLQYLQDIIPTLKTKHGKLRSWGPASYNRHRAHLMSMFKELLELEAIDADPVSSLKIQDELPAEREILTPAEQVLVSDYLKANHYNFWRFAQIFKNSGARIKEIMRLQVKDIDLLKQTVTLIAEKGSKRRRQVRTINDVVLPLWLELLENASPNDFIFGKGLQPAEKAIAAYQITRRWETHVKLNKAIQEANNGKHITADFYAFKHLHSDQTVEIATEQIAAELAMQAAAAQNGHTSPAMVRSIYAVNEKKREHERAKKAGGLF